MNFKLVTVSIMTALILSGCSAPDNIQTHNHLHTDRILAESQSLTSEPFSRADWPESDWWLALKDPQLNHLIDKSLLNSPDLQLADARLRQASSQVMQADSLFEPTLNAQTYMRRARLSRQEDYSFRGHRYSTSRGLGLDFSYSFDLWGGKKAAWEAAVDTQKAAEVEHQAARLQLSGHIVQYYVRLSNAYALLDLAEKDRARSARIVEITRQLLDHGLTSEDRLYTAQSSLAMAKQVVKKRRLAIRQLKNSLATIVGQGPDLAQDIQRPSLTMDTRLALPENLPAELMSHRPDITAARWRVEAASRNIKVAKTRFYPNFNLSAMAGFKSVLGDAVFGDVSRSWNVMPAFSLPVFTQGLKAGLLSETANYDAAVAQYNQVLIQSLGEVSDQILILQSIKDQLLDAKRSMTLAEKSYHITEKRYEAGMGSHLEVLMSEQQLLQAESEYVRLLNQQKEAGIGLIQSLGGGFQTPSESEPLNKLASKQHADHEQQIN